MYTQPERIAFFATATRHSLSHLSPRDDAHLRRATLSRYVAVFPLTSTSFLLAVCLAHAALLARPFDLILLLHL